MTEPTAEQVAMDRERARAQRVLDESKGWCGCSSCVEIVAIALRDRAIEAHAAGRDEGLEAAEKLVTERLEHWRQNCKDNIDAGCAPPQYNMGARSEASIAVRDIRALRGRTEPQIADPGAFRCPHRECHVAGAIPCDVFIRNQRQDTRWTP